MGNSFLDGHGRRLWQTWSIKAKEPFNNALTSSLWMLLERGSKRSSILSSWDASSCDDKVAQTSEVKEEEGPSTGEEGGSERGETDLDIAETHPDMGDSKGEEGGNGDEYSGTELGSGVIGLP